ncbi:MAG: ATP-binding protein [Myxococcota bacterium]
MAAEINTALREAYQAEQAERTYVNVRLFCVLCFCINQIFKAVDYLVTPDQFTVFLMFRLGLDAVLAYSYFRVTPWNSLALKRLVLIATGIMLSVVVNGTVATVSDYYVGFLLLMFGSVILFPMTGIEAFRLSSILYLTLLLPMSLGGPIEVNAELAVHNIFLISGIAITTVAASVSERIRIIEFMGRDELRRAYDQLKHLSEAKTQFFSNVSHELRTPLTLILAPLESVRHGDLGELTMRQRRYVNSMYENGLRLLRQINHLLDVVKIDADRAAPLREMTDIGLFVENLVSATHALAVRKRLSLKAMVDENLPHTSVDPEKFEKIVLNLLSNAIKFTPAGGSVLVAATHEGDSIRIRVTDSGDGISPEFLPRLFERFSQADGMPQQRFGGTGLGLTLVKEFTELHGGTVDVESAPGEGATFTVTLPVTETADVPSGSEPASQARTVDAAASLELSDASAGEVEEAEVPAAADEEQKRKPLVLVADDNNDMRRFMSDALGSDYRVVTAKDGIQALRLATEKRVDLAVLDVMMPGINGIDLVHRLRESEVTARTPIIMVTARVGLDQKIRGMQKGANDYLYKPFSVAEFKARVAGLLRQRSMEQELEARNRELKSKNVRLGELLIHQEKLSALGELLAGTAHELATPIAYVASNARALEGYLRDLETFVRTALAQGQKDDSLRKLAEKLDLENILEDLEDLSRGFIEGGGRAKDILRNLKTYSRRDEQVVANTDLRSCVESSLILLAGQLKGRVEVHREDEPGLPVIRCVEGQIKQVIVNLVSNAAQAISGEGDIWIATKVHPRGTSGFSRPCVELSVRDSGRGIPGDMLEEMFRPFVTTKEAGTGTGLGLPISRDIVNRHGGQIQVESEEGRGTVFTVFLPLSPSSNGDGGDFMPGRGSDPSIP